MSMTTVELMTQQTHYFQIYFQVRWTWKYHTSSSDAIFYVFLLHRMQAYFPKAVRTWLYFEKIQITSIFAFKQIRFVAEVFAEIN